MNNRQLRLASRPRGPVQDDTFTLGGEELPALAEDQFRVRTVYLSIDPALRGRLIDVPSYAAVVQIGEVMHGTGAGVVDESRHAGFEPGDRVLGPTGWQEYAIGGDGGGQAFRKLPAEVPLRQAVGVLGTTGLTAYFGLLDIGRPVSGETVVVSAAAGATGSVAGQIAKILGCRVVGIAGGREKCAWISDELGFDAAIDYREERIGRRLHELCPAGVDVFFDNVGGAILDSTLAVMNVRGRVVLCGTVSSGYGEGSRGDPIRNYFLASPRRLRLEGFIVSDYEDRFPEAEAKLAEWLGSGTLRSRETVVQGLEQAPAALRSIFEGANIGKLLVQVAPEPDQ